MEKPAQWQLFNYGKIHFVGSVVLIGNAPTALFRLLEMLQHGAEKPALIIGVPVGFVGAGRIETGFTGFAY